MTTEGIDPDIEIMSDAHNISLIKKKECRVLSSKKFNRNTMPRHYEQNVELFWAERQKTNPKLFNGTKFRLDSVTMTSKPTSVLTMNVGVTDYKDFIGTNWSPEAKDIRNLGLRDCNNSQTYMSDAMGVGAFVQTSDHFLILLRRSADCAEAACLWDVPGGHPEPKEIVGIIPAEDIDPDSLSPAAIVEEIYDSIVRETIDEVNIPRSVLSEPELIGIARNTTSAGRPSVEFFIRCSLTSGEVLSLYNTGSQAEAEESTAIKVVPVGEVPGLQFECPELWNLLAPSAKGCLTLYRQYIRQNGE
ncbi:hypothetical protein ScPMuIL_013968 [Solemya velum]